MCLYLLVGVIWIIVQHYYISSVLTADEGVDDVDLQQSSSDVQNHERSSSTVSGGNGEAASPKPPRPLAKEEPEDLREEDEECQDGGQSPISLNLTAVPSRHSKQEEHASDIPPSAASTCSPSAVCCERRTLDADEPPEDAGDQEDEKGAAREENSNVGVYSLTAGSLQEQVDVESGQDAEPSETLVGLKDGK